MSIYIEVKGNTDTFEYESANVLKEIFESGFPQNASGNILIYSNATLYGGATKDIDIVCFGELANCRLNKINFPMLCNKQLNPTVNATLEIHNFCFTIEVKSHPTEKLRKNGPVLLAEYQEGISKSFHDVTKQSEDQKYSLKNFLKRQIGSSPFISNYIWLRGVNDVKSTNLIMNTGNPNYLSNNFNVYDLFELTCKAQNISENGGIYHLYAWSKKNLNTIDIQKAFDVFSKNYNCMGELTRKKMEIVTKKILDKQIYAEYIGTKLTIISGRAGTGKTIKILRIACDLAKNHSKLCLLLTYNNALVSDMKRMLALAQFTDNVESPTVIILTIHKFIRELLLAFGLKNKYELNNNFITNYDAYLEELNEYICTGAIGDADINKLVKSRNELVGFDYIFIDESQDWAGGEKEILYKIFNYPKLIIADGVDQLIRSHKKCNWIKELTSDEVNKTYEKKCIRQKTNLVRFVNDYAKEFNINWNMDAEEKISGGNVIIVNQNFKYEIYKECYSKCKIDGNAAYDMLYIVPPCMVKKELIYENNTERVSSSFLFINDFADRGIKLWDGTSRELRTEYPVDVEEQRLVQYESCRGLEGWVVTCLELDEFIDYKLKTYKEVYYEEQQSNFLVSEEEKKLEYAYLWSLIPLTRAIDTLIITIKNPNSDFGQKLKKLYERNKDFVRWIG